MLPAVVICCVLLFETGYGSPLSDIVSGKNNQTNIRVKGAPTCDLETDDVGWLNHQVTKLTVRGPDSIEVVELKSDDTHKEALLRLKQSTVPAIRWRQYNDKRDAQFVFSVSLNKSRHHITIHLKLDKSGMCGKTDYWVTSTKVIIFVNIGSMDILVRYRNHSGNSDPRVEVVRMNDIFTSDVPTTLVGGHTRAESTIMDSGTKVQNIIAAIVNGALGDHSSPLCV